MDRMSLTFYLQDTNTGLFLTDADWPCWLALRELDFSIDQIWHWGEKDGNIFCGNGNVLSAYTLNDDGIPTNVNTNEYDKLEDDPKQLFQIGKNGDCITLSHQGKNVVHKEKDNITFVLSEENPCVFRQVPTEQGYCWKEVSKHYTLP